METSDAYCWIYPNNNNIIIIILLRSADEELWEIQGYSMHVTSGGRKYGPHKNTLLLAREAHLIKIYSENIFVYIYPFAILVPWQWWYCEPELWGGWKCSVSASTSSGRMWKPYDQPHVRSICTFWWPDRYRNGAESKTKHLQDREWIVCWIWSARRESVWDIHIYMYIYTQSSI